MLFYMYIFYTISLILFILLFMSRTCSNLNLLQDAYTQDETHTSPYPGVRTFHATKVLVLVVFWKSTLSLKCVCTLLTAYANLGPIKFMAFSVSFIFNATVYYLALSTFTRF